jgi:hypothetical protein
MLLDRKTKCQSVQLVLRQSKKCAREKLGSMTKSLAYFESQIPQEKQRLRSLIARINECRRVISGLIFEKNRLRVIINSQTNESARVHS